MSASLYFKSEKQAGFINLADFGDVNLSNSNCRFLLTALGFSPNFEDDGAQELAELEKAISLFENSELSKYVDGGTETREEIGSGGCCMIHCGRRENYFQDTIEQIKHLIPFAKEKGATQFYFC